MHANAILALHVGRHEWVRRNLRSNTKRATVHIGSGACTTAKGLRRGRIETEQVALGNPWLDPNFTLPKEADRAVLNVVDIQGNTSSNIIGDCRRDALIKVGFEVCQTT